MKVSELEGAQLDYWVARAEGHEAEIRKDEEGEFCVRTKRYPEGGHCRGAFHPSLEWATGGPIIDRERIGSLPRNGAWIAGMPEWPTRHHQTGPTPLVAAMRAYVESKYGEEVPD